MDEELNKILSNEELDTQAKKDAIKAYVGKGFVPMNKHSEQANELSTLKAEFETFKQSKMTDEEKNAEAIRIAQEKEQKTNRMLSQMFAENVFAKAGIKEEAYKDIIANIIQDDAEATKAIAEKICNSMVKQKEEIEKTLRKQIADGQKKPDGGDGNKDVSETDIEKYEKLLADAISKNDFSKQAYYTRLIHELKQKTN